jgi:deazaflavin-dependent oxidoreductase (nitroreductase family)
LTLQPILARQEAGVTQIRRPDNWNQQIIDEFRANGGKVGGYFKGAHMILIHHIGARTGTERVNPLTYLPDGEDMVIAATKGGHPTNPDWYYNLKAHPQLQVEVGTETFPVEATEVTGEERDELWRRLVELRPGFAEYEKKTTRVFPMFRLKRVS